MRRALLASAVALIALAVGASWRVLWVRAEGRYRAGIREAKVAAKSGSLNRARQILDRTAASWPGRGEAEFLLGSCELALRRPGAAREAWESIPPDSPFAPGAAMMLARLALAGDRMAEAERYLPTALDAPDPLGKEARESLLMIYKLQGRYEEARRLVRDGWDRYSDRVGTLQELWRLDTPTPLALGDSRRTVERAERSAPEDDRVWLARARLALRDASYDEAARWLERCTRRRPADHAAWHGWLDWALAVGDEARARLALEHLDPTLVPPTEVLALRAWFAARAADPEAERRALGRLLELDSGSLPALDRLAALALQAGDDDEVARLRARRAELDRLVDRYTERMFLPDPVEDAEALARWSEGLGRLFDARGWWKLAAERVPSDRAAIEEALGRIARAEIRRSSGPDLTELRAELGPAPSGDRRVALAAPRGPTGPMPRFVDDAEAAGLGFVFESGRSPRRQIPETMGGGIGLLDFDRNGWLDVYIAQGGRFPPDPADAPSGDRLYRNRGDGTFEDATASAGIAGFRQGYGHGVAVGDYDGDGDPDLFVTRWGSYALYRNRGDGTFEDATEGAGLGGDRDWPTSAAWADLDGDADLDLYVCHYLVWDPDHPKICPDAEGKHNLLCNPGLFESRPDHLFRNDGGRFVDVTAEAGIVDEHGRGLGVVAADFDDDGRIDLYVANDQTANFLWRNLGGFRFEEVGALAGVAAGGHGGYLAGMGVACGDLDGDGRPDLAVTNFYNEGTTLYRNLGRGIFIDTSAAIGLSAATRSRLGFGLAFLDANNDGRLDLASANGHVDDFRPAIPYAMPAQLMLGSEGGRLTDVSDRAGPPWEVERVGRALAPGDLDNDGRVDLLLLSLDGPLAFFHNRTDGGHWLTLALEGTASNRDAVGARVTVAAGGRHRVGWRVGGGSYQASGDPRAHFGLGPAARIDSVEVRWPSGRVDRHAGLPTDAGYLIREGETTPRPLPGRESVGSPAR